MTITPIIVLLVRILVQSSDADPASLKAVSLAKDTVHFFRSDQEEVVVMLVNNYSCKDCIQVLAAFLDSSSNARKGDQASAYALFRCGASTLVRREKKQEIEQFAKNLQVLFEAQGDVPDDFPPVNITDGVFGAFRVSYTPALLRFTRHNQEVRYFSYQELFADSIKLKPSFTDQFD